MHMFTRKTEPAAHANESARPSVVPGPSNRAFMPTPSGALLSRGGSIKGAVKFLNELIIDGEVEGHHRFYWNAHHRGARAHTR
jgi:hypothetical protein